MLRQTIGSATSLRSISNSLPHPTIKSSFTAVGAIASTYSGVTALQSLNTASQPVHASQSSHFSSTPPTTAKPTPRPIPTPDPDSFQYYTPITAPGSHPVMTFPHTIHGKNPRQIFPPSMPTKQFLWSENVRNFAKKLWAKGFNHEARAQNPFNFSPFHASHRGKLEVEFFHKTGPGHPINPEENGDLTNLLANADPKLAHHPAFPFPGPNGEEPVISTIGVCHAGPYSQGPPLKVHGGAIASIADVVCYCCVGKSGRKTVTANLNVNYRTSVPICKEFICATTVRFLGDRKAQADFVMFDLDMTTIHAEGTGLFVTPKEWVGQDKFDYTQELCDYFEQHGFDYQVQPQEGQIRLTPLPHLV